MPCDRHDEPQPMQPRDFTPADPNATPPKVRTHIPVLDRKNLVIAPDVEI